MVTEHAYARWLVIAALVCGALMLVSHFVAVVADAARPMHYDENEYLHSSWLMAAGKHLYRDFYEDHPPHFFLLLDGLMPGGDVHQVDVRQWAVRARVATGLCSVILVSLLGLMAWRISGNPAGLLIPGAVMLSSRMMWARALTDIRAEPPTLALFWAGIVLIAWSAEVRRSQALRAGIGIGLMFLAALTNPKWPLECLVMGAVYLHYLWRVYREQRRLLGHAVVPAVLVAAIAIVPIVATTSFSDYVYFVFALKSHIAGAFTAQPWVREFFELNSLWNIDRPLKWQWFAVVGLFVIAAGTRRNARALWILVALHIASLIELRFIFPYPYLWVQYMVLVATTAAVFYGLLPGALANVIERLRRPLPPKPGPDAIVWIVVLSLAAIAWSAYAGLFMAPDRSRGWAWWVGLLGAAIAWLPVFAAAALGSRKEMTGAAMVRPLLVVAGMTWAVTATLAPTASLAGRGFQHPQAWRVFWERGAAVQSQLKPGDTVWMSPPHHPVAAFDASYFGYSFSETLPFVIEYARTHETRLPRLEFAELPLCRIAKGEKTNVRFVEFGEWLPYLKGSCECGEAAYQRGLLRPIEYFGVFEVAPAPQPPVEKWARETDTLWANLCANKDVFGIGGPYGILERRWNFGR